MSPAIEANSRVIDLTKRLRSVTDELAQARRELGSLEGLTQNMPRLKSDLFKARVELEAVKIRQLRESPQ